MARKVSPELVEGKNGSVGGGRTKVFGIIGYPIGHTLSPPFHNAAFKALKMDAVYVPFEVEPARLADAVKGLAALGVSGVNVTIPHKEAVIPLLDEVSAQAKGIGAVNVIVIREKRTTGHNTDGQGFLASLKRQLGFTPAGKSFFVLGAGGAARAVVYVLAKEEAASITLVDIAHERARHLAAKTKREFPKCRTRSIPYLKSRIDEEVVGAEVLINATPVGMKRGEPSIVSLSSLHKGLVVCDLVYNPPQTELLKEARKRGLKAVNGVAMLLHQGALSFELFTGRKAPLSVMRAALERCR